MIRYRQHLLLQLSISSAQSFCCSCGAYANKQDMASKHIHQRFNRDLTGQLVAWSTSHLPVAPWLVLFWLMPSRIVGNGNETFFSHLSTWLKSTHPHSLRDSLVRNWRQVILGFFREPTKTTKTTRMKATHVARFCPVRSYKAAITSFLIILSAYYLILFSQLTNQSILRYQMYPTIVCSYASYAYVIYLIQPIYPR